jgi:hypothetical protein
MAKATNMVVNGSKHGLETRLKVATEWASSGNLHQVSRITGISRSCIRGWRDSGEAWWVEAVDKARLQIGNEILSTQLTNARLAGEQLTDRIENGDTKVMANGTTVNVPMNGKDLAVVNGIQVDKARTALNMPNHISTNSGGMPQLMAQFEAMALASQARQLEASVVSTQPKDNNDIESSED